MSDRISVLLVDDDPDLLAVTASYLEREDDRIAVETAEDAATGLEALDECDVECVVSDYEMPGGDGLEFLQVVRERDPDLPFILHTGRGSEEIASEAISAGVTDYIQKRGGTERYERLANRVVEAVEKCRAERDADRMRRQLEAIADHSRDAILTVDDDGTIRFANPAVERLFGYAPGELVGEPLATLTPRRNGDELLDTLERHLDVAADEGDGASVELSGRHRDGSKLALSVSFGEFERDGERRFVGISRDVTERERHRAFVEHSSDVVAALDADGTFQYVSPSAERILGHDPEELVGENAFSYVHPDDREAVVETFEESADGDSSTGSESSTRSVEYRVRCADGGHRWVESVGNSWLDDNAIGGYVVNTRDISDRKEREQTLARLREWTRELNYARTVDETAQLAVDAVDDLVDAGLSGIHLRSDDGDRLEPVALGDSVPMLFDEQPTYERGAPPGTRAALVWEAFRGDGSIVIDEVSTYEPLAEETPAESLVLRPVGDHGLFVVSAPTAHEFTDTDVLVAGILSEHLEAALDRAERERRLEQLHGATRTLVRAESREEIAQRAVEAAEDVLGFSVVTVRIHDPDAGGLVPAAVSEFTEELLPERETFTPDGGSLNWRAFEAGEVRTYDDIRETDALDADTPLRSLMILPVGEFGTLSVGKTEPEVFDGTDEFLARILATAVETAFQAAERTRRLHERSRELERQNDRLEEFASVVSHDLRNPLNVAQGRVELAAEECGSEHLDAAVTAHERMEALIDDLLVLAREGETVSETDPVRVADAVRGCWSTVDTADAVLSVETDLTLRADESRLRQLLENLIRNAVEHGGDDVTITAGALDGGFYVADDGPGIPANERDAVFDAGYSTSESGTGFGLRIVEQVADAHGWEVRAVESEAGGARFEVTGVESAA
ncbi:PAS domain S-box protein [Halorubrum sp. BOL3-1]|uniref:hybrid sensor histidine kinase/response regulator n=1 Tax=Halorubrum sp. BOL3-1 TaxID=2497325 RepID=UPI00100506D3|nr:PAS domain S-box protein [Halorubrum sp. BOL3-1]QAU12069.1 PAS domain S-box protein [Halorubrum sp. BOL3-1]